MGSEIILAPPGRNDFDVLSGTGAIIWELLEDPCTEAQVVATLADMYGVTEAHISADVKELISTLVRCGAIEELSDNDDSER